MRASEIQAFAEHSAARAADHAIPQSSEAAIEALAIAVRCVRHDDLRALDRAVHEMDRAGLEMLVVVAVIALADMGHEDEDE